MTSQCASYRFWNPSTLKVCIKYQTNDLCRNTYKTIGVFWRLSSTPAIARQKELSDWRWLLQDRHYNNTARRQLTKKHEQDTNQNLRGNFVKRSASSQQQHPDHENLLLAKAATQFLKSRRKPMISLCGFAYKSKNVRRTVTTMDMKLLQLFS